jgi:hypothetical protein
MSELKRTGVHRTYDGWNGSLGEYLSPGDTVDELIVRHFIDVLPPAVMSSRLLQMGEAADDRGPNGQPRFLTLQRPGPEAMTAWVYTGPRPIREYVTITD